MVMQQALCFTDNINICWITRLGFRFYQQLQWPNVLTRQTSFFYCVFPCDATAQIGPRPSHCWGF